MDLGLYERQDGSTSMIWLSMRAICTRNLVGQASEPDFAIFDCRDAASSRVIWFIF